MWRATAVVLGMCLAGMSSVRADGYTVWIKKEGSTEWNIAQVFARETDAEDYVTNIVGRDLKVTEARIRNARTVDTPPGFVKQRLEFDENAPKTGGPRDTLKPGQKLYSIDEYIKVYQQREGGEPITKSQSQPMDELIEANRKRRELEGRQKTLEDGKRKIQDAEKREGAGFRQLDKWRKQIGDVRDAIRNKENEVAQLSAEVADLKKRVAAPGLEGRTLTGTQSNLTLSFDFGKAGVVRGGNSADRRNYTGSYSVSGNSFAMTIADSTYVGTIGGNRISGRRSRTDGYRDTFIGKLTGEGTLSQAAKREMGIAEKAIAERQADIQALQGRLQRLDPEFKDQFAKYEEQFRATQDERRKWSSAITDQQKGAADLQKELDKQANDPALRAVREAIQKGLDELNKQGIFKHRQP